MPTISDLVFHIAAFENNGVAFNSFDLDDRPSRLIAPHLGLQTFAGKTGLETRIKAADTRGLTATQRGDNAHPGAPYAD